MLTWELLNGTSNKRTVRAFIERLMEEFDLSFDNISIMMTDSASYFGNRSGSGGFI